MRLEPGRHEWLLCQQAGAQLCSGVCLAGWRPASPGQHMPMQLCRSVLTGCARQALHAALKCRAMRPPRARPERGDVTKQITVVPYAALPRSQHCQHPGHLMRS